MICAATPERPGSAPGEGVVELVRPAGVVEEVGRRQRDVDVAALLDRLAGVHRLDHGELAGALLHDPRDAVEVLGALAAGEARPDVVVRAAGGRDGPIDIGLRSASDAGERLLCRRVDHLEGGARLAGRVLVVDEEPVLAPDRDVVGRLRGGGVLPRGAALGEPPRGRGGPALRLLDEGHAADYLTELSQRRAGGVPASVRSALAATRARAGSLTVGETDPEHGAGRDKWFDSAVGHLWQRLPSAPSSFRAVRRARRVLHRPRPRAHHRPQAPARHPSRLRSRLRRSPPGQASTGRWAAATMPSGCTSTTSCPGAGATWALGTPARPRATHRPPCSRRRSSRPPMGCTGRLSKRALRSAMTSIKSRKMRFPSTSCPSAIDCWRWAAPSSAAARRCSGAARTERRGPCSTTRAGRMR